MPLTSIRQIGDVILVDDETAIDDEVNVWLPSAPWSTAKSLPKRVNPWGGCGALSLTLPTGGMETIVIASFGLPQIPDQVISTYELSIEEVVSSGPDRLIVFEGAEEKMVQLSVGSAGAPGHWQRPVGYAMTIANTSCQSPPRTSYPLECRCPADFSKARTPAAEERWSDDDWGEPELVEAPRPAAQPAERYQQAEMAVEDSNWNDAPEPAAFDADFQEVSEDVWSEEEGAEPYEAPPVNIPQKKKVTEYEEELDY
jgi:hypothetical protein